MNQYPVLVNDNFASFVFKVEFYAFYGGVFFSLFEHIYTWVTHAFTLIIIELAAGS
jgi:hypothetical protein